MNERDSAFDLFQVTGPSFCAGLIFKDYRYYRAAPIIRGVAGTHNSYRTFRAYCQKHGWALVHLSSWEGADERKRPLRNLFET